MKPIVWRNAGGASWKKGTLIIQVCQVPIPHKSQFAACLISLLLSLQSTVSLQSCQDSVCVSVWTPEHHHKIKQNSIMAGCKIMISQKYCQLTVLSFDVAGVELTTAIISSVPTETSCERVNDRHKVEIILTWTNSFSFHKHGRVWQKC